MLFILKQYLKSNNVREITMVMTISDFIFITFMMNKTGSTANYKILIQINLCLSPCLLFNK